MPRVPLKLKLLGFDPLKKCAAWGPCFVLESHGPSHGALIRPAGPDSSCGAWHVLRGPDSFCGALISLAAP